MTQLHITGCAEREWMILRASLPRQTKALMEELNFAGFTAWTPIQTIRRIKDGKSVEVPLCLTPPFVFVDHAHVADMLRLAHSPAQTFRIWDSAQRRMVTHGIPFFRVFAKQIGGVAIVPDRHLAPLRAIERKSRPTQAPRALKAGERIRLTEAGFEGLWATVEWSKKTFTRLAVDGSPFPHTFPTLGLVEAIDANPRSNLHPSQQALTANAA